MWVLWLAAVAVCLWVMWLAAVAVGVLAVLDPPLLVPLAMLILQVTVPAVLLVPPLMVPPALLVPPPLLVPMAVLSLRPKGGCTGGSSRDPTSSRS